MDIHAIAALTGQGADAYADITRPAAAIWMWRCRCPHSLPADLLARRPDILAAQARIEAAMQGREAAHADFYPNINLAALVGFQAIGLANLFTGNAFTMGVGPAIHLPIFDAGKIRAQYAGATADLDAAVADYNGAVVGAIKQTADAMTQVQSLAAQRAQQQAGGGQRRARLRSGRGPLSRGLVRPDSHADRRSHLAAGAPADGRLVTARRAQQRITLLLSVGGGFDPDHQIFQTCQQDVTP